MPNNKEQTYVVKFKAQAEGLDQIVKDIAKISQGGDIKLTDKLKADITKIQNQSQMLLQTLVTESEKATPNTETLKQAYGLFKEIADVAQKIGLSMSSLVVPKEFQTQLEQFTRELNKQEEALVQLQEQLRKNESIVGARGGATAKARSMAFSQAGGAQLDSGSNTPFETITGVKTQIQSLKNANKQEGLDPAVYEENAKKIQELEQFVNSYNAALNKLTTTAKANIAAINGEISAAKNLIQQTREQVAATEAQITATQNEIQTSNSQVATATQITSVLSNLTDVRNKQADAVEENKNQLAAEKQAAQEEVEEQKRIKDALQGATGGVDNQNKSLETNTTTLGRAAKQVFTYGTALTLLKKIYRETLSTITELDKALTDMAVVTTMSREQTWELVGSFQDLADATGKTTTEIANMATKFYQQGKSTTQVLQLTEAAAKAATIAGIDGSRSIDLLTNAMNGFQLSASSAMEVSDKFAALAAASATDYEELAVALSKVAAQANLAGMSMDFTLGMLAKGIEVTREAPETIGTALKTVISRMRELTDYDVTLEDGTDVNRVEKALNNVNVALRDENGEFRDLEDVLTELGTKWNTLNKNQQANVAVALAGTRQQSRLIAMMQDFDRTLELVDVSANSYGATMAQSAKYMEGLEAATTRLTNAWQQVITTISDSKFIIGIVDAITGIINGVDYIFSHLGTMIPVMAALSVIALGMLSSQIQKIQLQREEKRLAEEEASLQRQRQIEAIQNAIDKRKSEAIAAKTAEINGKKERKQQKELLLAEKQRTLEIKRQNILQNSALNENAKQVEIAKIEAEYNSEAVELQSEMASLDSEIQTKEQELKELKDANLATEREELTLKQLKSQEEEYQIKAEAKQASLLTDILSTVGLIQTVLAAIKAVQIGINVAKTIYLKLQEKNLLLSAKEKAETIGKALAEMAKNAAGNLGVPGLIIAAALLAAAGVAVAVSIAKANQAEDSVDATSEALDGLQAEIYNLNQSITTVRQLGDEFDSLSSKIVKTTDDLTRMNEIAQEVNDTLGYAAVDLDADSATQALQIKGALKRQEEEKAAKVQESGEELAEGFYDDLSLWKRLSYIANPEALAKDKAAYISELGESGKNTLRNIAINQIEGLAEQSAETQEIIQGLFLSMAPDMMTKEGFDVNKFLNSDIIGGNITSFMAELEKVTQDGSLGAYEQWLMNLTEDQQELVTSNNAYLASVKRLHDLGAIDTFDNMGLANDEINDVIAVVNELQGTLEANGVKGSDVYQEMANNSNMSMSEMYKQISDNGDAWLAHVKELNGQYNDDAEYRALQEQKGIKETEKAALEAKKNLSEEEKQRLNTLTGELEEITEAEKKWTNPEEYVAGQKAKAKAVLLVDNAVSDYTDSLTALGSSLERLNKVLDVNSLSLSEQMELLNDYPELINAMRDGNLDAATSLKILSKQYEKTKDQLETDISNKAVEWADTEKSSILSKAGLTGIFDTGNEQMLYNQSALGLDDFTEAMKNKGLTEDEITTLWGAISATAAKNYQLDKLEEGGIAALLETDFDADAKTNQYNKTQALYEQLNDELDDLIEGSDEYNTKLGERDAAIKEHLKSIQAQLDDEDESQLKKFFGDIEGYDDIRNAFEIINGQVIINAENYEKLTDTQKAALQLQYGNLVDYAEKQKDLADEEQELYVELAQSYIDQQTRIKEAEIEALEARKEALEKYFEEVDALEEAEDRVTEHDSLVKQIAALTGALDGTSKSKIKELQAELETLKEEEIAAQKESQRDALLSSIETDIDALNTDIDKLSNSIYELAAAIRERLSQKTSESESADQTGEETPDNQLEIDTNLEITIDTETSDTTTTTKPSLATVGGGGGSVSRITFAKIDDMRIYKKGGLVDYTGPAWVDGTPTQPEAFLNTADTRLIQDLVSALKLDSLPDSGSNVTIEKIEIRTDQLNSNQDFASAGTVLGEAFNNAIRTRGINTNARK